MLQKVLKFIKANPWLIEKLSGIGGGKKKRATKRKNEDIERKVNVLWSERDYSKID